MLPRQQFRERDAETPLALGAAVRSGKSPELLGALRDLSESPAVHGLDFRNPRRVSLFAGHPALEELTGVVAVQDAPRPPYRRLTLSLSFLVSTAEIWVVALGERKRAVVQAAASRSFGHTPPSLTPFDMLLRHAAHVTVFTDQAVRRG